MGPARQRKRPKRGPPGRQTRVRARRQPALDRPIIPGAGPTQATIVIRDCTMSGWRWPAKVWSGQLRLSTAGQSRDARGGSAQRQRSSIGQGLPNSQRPSNGYILKPVYASDSTLEVRYTYKLSLSVQQLTRRVRVFFYFGSKNTTRVFFPPYL